MAWDDVSFIVSSKGRKTILLKLETPKTPTILAESVDMTVANVSRTLIQLEKKGIAVCLTPKKRIGRIYSLTEKGKEVLAKVKEME